jgi:hypothetical protein
VPVKHGELLPEICSDDAAGIVPVCVAVHDDRGDAAIDDFEGLHCPPQLVDPVANAVRLRLTGQ